MDVGFEVFGVDDVLLVEAPLEAVEVLFVVLFGGEENFICVDELLCSFVAVRFEVPDIRSQRLREFGVFLPLVEVEIGGLVRCLRLVFSHFLILNHTNNFIISNNQYEIPPIVHHTIYLISITHSHLPHLLIR